MSIFEPARPEWTGRMLSVLRIVAGAVFIFHGTQKLFAYPPSPASGGSSLDLLSQTGLAGILETFGGAAIVIGFCTRPVAFVLAGEMAVAYFQVHFKRGFLPILNGGDNAVLFCFIFLYLLFAGAGPWSIDHMFARRRAAVPATSRR